MEEGRYISISDRGLGSLLDGGEGSLELWNDTHMIKEYSPLFGRMVIFSVSKRSCHEHPWRLQAPIPRESIALCYNSNAVPEIEENDEFYKHCFAHVLT